MANREHGFYWKFYYDFVDRKIVNDKLGCLITLGFVSSFEHSNEDFKPTNLIGFIKNKLYRANKIQDFKNKMIFP